jgi:capsular exopolysaccharide synthesis family protein
MNPSLPTVVAQDQDSELLDLAELFRTLNRYKWSILGIGLLIAVLTALLGSAMPKYYRATASLLIESKLAQPVPVADVTTEGPGEPQRFYEYFASQFEILKSRDLVGKVVDKLKLVDDAEFAEQDPSLQAQAIEWPAWLSFLNKDEQLPTSKEALKALWREKVVDTIIGGDGESGRLSAVPVIGTQVLKLQIKARDAELAATMTNTLADLYIESALQARLDMTRKTSSWLTGKLADIRSQLEASEKTLQEYREKQQLVNVGGTRTLGEDELIDATKRLRDAQRRKTELASAYSRVQQAANDPEQLAQIPLLLTDARVTTASNGFVQAEAALKQVRERYGDKHPSMTVVKAGYDSARNSYYQALRVAAQGVKSDYEIAADNERALSRVVAGSRETIKDLDKKQYEASQLERDVASNRELYNMFLTRFKQTDSINNFENATARVIDPAVVPRKVFEPRVARMTVIAGIVGLILGFLLAMLRYLLSEEVRSAEDLEVLTQAPVLGAITKVDKGDARTLATLFLTKPQTPFSEGIRSVRTALQLSDVDKKYHRLLITSSVPQEGKSSLASALAESFAAIEQVLLVDTDLRKPSLAKKFGLPDRSPGLTELLSGQAKLEDCLHLHQQSGVYLLPAGRHVPNPAEVLASLAFKSLVDDLSKRFSRVMFDSPPCQASADALQLSQHVDGVLFVVKSGSTSRRIIKNSYKLLRNVNAPILGNVVNQLDTKKAGLAYYGYYAYGYYGKQGN